MNILDGEVADGAFRHACGHARRLPAGPPAAR